jgi:hypothetical protein
MRAAIDGSELPASHQHQNTAFLKKALACKNIAISKILKSVNVMSNQKINIPNPLPNAATQTSRLGPDNRAVDGTVIRGLLRDGFASRQDVAWVYKVGAWQPESSAIQNRSHLLPIHAPVKNYSTALRRRQISSLDRAAHQAGSISDRQQSPVERWDNSCLQA